MSEKRVLSLRPQAKAGSCRLCRHYRVDYESWEMPWVSWAECAKYPGRSNLKSFPFKAPKCFEAKQWPALGAQM